MTSPRLRPVPAYAPIVVCTLCQQREIGADGLWMEPGCAYCRPCLDQREAAMAALGGKS